jgi:hypothetical protein
MGLDMYLDKEKLLSEFNNGKDLIAPILKIVGAKDEGNNYRHTTVSVPAIYWRKCNAIHNWFVQNVQNGMDNCEKYYVGEKELKELLALVKEQLKNKKQILLEPKAGFFFGSTEIDDWYWEEMKRTEKELERELKYADDGWTFTYQSSW